MAGADAGTFDDGIACGKCGEPIIGELSGGDPQQRKPCPKCGSTSRQFAVRVQVTATTSATVQAQVITYPRTLLDVARRLIDQGQFSIAVVVAHMACEIATERSLSESFSAKGVGYLEEAVTDLLNGNNLASNRIRTLYTALTGDNVQQATFWQKFKASAELRNKIVHGGKIAGKQDAEDSYAATSDLVAHLRK
jgi:hypothetical protein